MLIKRKRVFAAKIEGTAGTAEALTAAEATVNIFNPKITPNIEMEDRESQGSFGMLPSVAGPRAGTATFRTELFGDGAGGIPLWASIFLPACGWVATSQVYTPRTEGPGSNVKTLTLGCFENGLYRQLHGAMGTFVMTLTAGKIAYIDWTFTGIYTAPTDVEILAPTYLTTAPFRFVAETLTLGSWTPILNEIKIDAGNVVENREDATKTSGILTAMIKNRKPTGTMDPEAKLVATVDHGTKWLAGTQEALTIEIDNGTDRLTIAAPKCQRMKVEDGDRNGNQTDMIDFMCGKSAAAGDDEISFTFAATDA